MQIGLIGLGLMGIPMGKRILTGNYSLLVYNRTPGKAGELIENGAKEATSIEEILQNCDVVITMVTNGKAVEEVLFKKDGSLRAQMKDDAIVIDMSTIWVAWAHKLHTELAKHKVSFIDAPVTGSTPKAKTGELTIFIGGDAPAIEKVIPVFSTMGTNLLRMGESGCGQAMKMVNNHFIATFMAGFSEAINNGEKLGLSRDAILTSLKNVPAMSPYLLAKFPLYENREYPPMFSVANILKDVRLASDGIEDTSKLPILKACEKLLEETCEMGYRDEDLAAMDRWFSQN